MGRIMTLVCALTCAAGAQVRPPPTEGRAALDLALRRLEGTACLMIVNAHPDDENNALIAMASHGMGARVVEVTATRGEGGQNDLGPARGLELSVLRTEELLAVHRIDGAEQLFMRAVDFGYSFSVEETFARWGREEILDDCVRLIRAVRPDVIVTMAPDGGGGGQHHQASARIAREAFHAAADPGRFPAHAAAGLRPWQAGRLFISVYDPPRSAARRAVAESRRVESAPAWRPGDVAIDADVFDPQLGATYHEIGTLARSFHKTQGMARLLALPGPAVSRFRPMEGVEPPSNAADSRPARTASALFGDYPQGFVGLGRFCKDAATAIEAMNLLALVDHHVADARVALVSGAQESAVGPLVAALGALRAARRALPSLLDGDPDAAYEIEHRLGWKQPEIVRAVAIASGLRFEALVHTPTAAPGDEVEVTVYVANRLAAPLTFESTTLLGFDPVEGGCETRPREDLPRGGLVTCKSKARVPKDAAFTNIHWAPLPDAARSAVAEDVPFGAPFRPSPFRARAVLAFRGAPVTFETVVEYRDGSDPVAGEKRHDLLVVPRGNGPPVQRVEAVHTRRRHIVGRPPSNPPAPARLATPRRVGYVGSLTDPADEYLTALGAEVRDLRPSDIARGDFGDLPVILVAARALELSEDLRRASKGLLKYVEGGGTLVILYQRSGLSDETCAPYPASTGTRRVSDENSVVTILQPEHPVFSAPNAIMPEDWTGWVQDRGRSFLDTEDARYVDLVTVQDPFEFNPEPQRGVLVEARVGMGRWVYVGLALSLQLAEGVPGAYRLLENLVSLSAR